MTTAERKNMAEASESVLVAIHSIRRAIRYGVGDCVKDLGNNIYDDLSELDRMIRDELRSMDGSNGKVDY